MNQHYHGGRDDGGWEEECEVRRREGVKEWVGGRWSARKGQELGGTRKEEGYEVEGGLAREEGGERGRES